MKLFQQSYGMITIRNNDEQVTLPVHVFQQCEPDYSPSLYPIRIWMETRHCLNDGGNDYPDPDFSATQFDRYCSNIALYLSLLPIEPEEPEEPEEPDIRERRLQTLNNDLHTYLTSRGYDTGTQLSFQAIYTDLLEKQITGQAKQQIRAAFDFVMGVVMPWYYQKKSDLETTDDFMTYTWDFHELDALDPGVSLRDILTIL